MRKNELNNLIRSLSPSEKRYFRLRASLQGNDKNYLRLFDLVEATGSFDEKIIREHFKGEKFLRYLPRAKHYLHQLILQSLVSFRTAGSPVSRVKELLDAVAVLHEKGLYDQAYRQLQKAHSIARAYEFHTQLLDVLRWERKIWLSRKELEVPEMEKLLNRNYKEEKETFAFLENTHAYARLSSELFLAIQQVGFARDLTQRKRLQRIIEDPMMKDDTRALTYAAKNFFFHIWGLYFHAVGNMEEAYRWRKERVLRQEAHPLQMEIDPVSYIYAMNNLILSCATLRKDDEFMEHLNRLKSFKAESAEARARLFETSCHLEQDFHIARGEFEKAYQMLDEIEEKMDLYGHRLDKGFEIVLLYNSAHSCFGVGDYRGALAWLQKIIHQRIEGQRQDIAAFAHILNLLVHFELGNRPELEYYTRSTYTYLYRGKRLFRFEPVLLKYIKRLARTEDRTSFTPEFIKMKEEMEEVMENSTERRVLSEYFDLMSWLESKITGRPFGDLVKKNYRAYAPG